jgi:perosamine synthetase
MINRLFHLSQQQIYCGSLGLELRQLFTQHDKNNIISWFENKKVIYFHKTRSAIRYACDVLAIESGDKILAPSCNCGAEIDPLFKSGATVSFYRVDEAGLIDTEDIQKRIDAKTKMIYITQYFGFPQPQTKIKKICNERDIYD